MIKEIKIPLNVINYIQCLFYETESLKALISFLIENNKDSIYIKQYKQEYEKKYLEYATARDEIIDLYAKENNIDLYCSSVIDFNNRKIIFTICNKDGENV